uniref:Uncharacterized protein n=1 Tax=Aegilops tauschii subsp. strangulata TaxID=200361 RepID=A0A453MR80_AEGTS
MISVSFQSEANAMAKPEIAVIVHCLVWPSYLLQGVRCMDDALHSNFLFCVSSAN